MAEATTEAVWSKLSDDLRRFIRRRVVDDHAADDLLQETFVRVHRGLGALEDGDRLTAWVYRIARNVVHDHYRERSPSAALLEDVAAAAEESRACRPCAGTDAWMGELIGELPETYREAVRLSEVEGLTQQEVADRLGLSLSGAKSRVQRGRELLREAIDRCCTFQLDRRGNVMDYDPKPTRTVCRDCGE